MDQGSEYEVMLAGRLGQRTLAALPGFEVLDYQEGHTRVRGWIRDQAALQGALRRLGDLGVSIEGLQRVDRPD